MNKIVFLLLLFFFFSCNNNNGTIDNSKYYKFIGEVNDTCDIDIDLEKETEYNYIKCKGGEVVPDVQTAFAVAYIYAKRIYGDEINKELPFSIELENNKLWRIRGDIKVGPYGCGGCMEMGIVKRRVKYGIYFIVNRCARC